MHKKNNKRDGIEALSNRRTKVLMGASQSDKSLLKVFFFFFIYLFLINLPLISAPEPLAKCGDGLCDSKIGEDIKTCPADCKEIPEPVITESFTHTTKTTCIDGRCSLIISAGTEYAKNNKGEWVHYTQAESLKDNGFEVVVLEQDEKWDLKVLDFNATSITFETNPKGITIFPYSTDLKVLEVKETVLNEGKEDEIITKEIIEKESYLESFNLLNQKNTHTLDFSIGDKLLKFGDNSTIITLQTAGSENLGDTYIRDAQSYPSPIAYAQQNFGTSTSFPWNVVTNWLGYTLIRFNISSLPEDANIVSAELSFWGFNNGLDAGTEGFNVSVQRLHETCEWEETVVTWNNFQCWDNVSAISDSLRFFGGTGEPLGWHDFNVAPLFEGRESNEKISFFLKMHDMFGSPATNDNVYTRSKDETTNSSQRPKLIIEYEEGGTPPDTTPPLFSAGSPFNMNVEYGSQITQQINATDETAFGCFSINDTTNFQINCSGYFTNNTSPISLGIYNLNVTINDTIGNINSTIFYVNVTDSVFPTWSNNKTNLEANTPKGSSIYFNITLSDLLGESYIFSWYNGTDWENNTGTWTNNEEIEIVKTLNILAGQINWTWYFNDTSNNLNQTDVWSVNVINPPLINIVYPLDSGMYNYTLDELNYTVEVLSGDSCWYSLDSGETNITESSGVNFTSVSYNTNGVNNVNLWCNDSSGLIGEDTISFTIDITFPVINITNPIEGAYYSYGGLPLEYNYTDENPGTCWVEEFSTYKPAGDWWDVLPGVEGANTWTLTCNDTAGNVNSTSVSFVVDNTDPFIQFNEPTTGDSSWLNVSTILLNFTVYDNYYKNLTVFLYNSTGTVYENSTYNWSAYSLDVYEEFTDLGEDLYYDIIIIACDLADRCTSDGVGNIKIDLTAPTSIINSPPNGTITNIPLQNFSVNITEAYGLKNGSLWIFNTSGLYNNTWFDLAEETGTISVGIIINLIDGIYNWFFETWDLAGNYFMGENATITVDTLYPTFSDITWNFTSGVDYEEGRTYGVNLTITNSNGTAGIEFDETNYTLDADGDFYTGSIGTLSPKIYNYYLWSYGSEAMHNYNTTEVYTYIVKSIPDFIFLANGGTDNLTLEYPQQINITAISINGTVGLDKNEVDDLANNSLNQTLEVGEYIFRANVTGNESVANLGYRYYNITIVDTTPPEIIIISPGNTTYNSKTQLLNISANDYHIESIWYNWNGSNITYTGEIEIEFVEGSNTLEVWANDTFNNVNYSSVTFTIDLPPTLTINTPTEGSTNNLVFKYNQSCTDTQGVSSQWYFWQGTNHTYTNPLDLYASAGSQTITAYCNDTYGSMVSISRSFTTTATQLTNQTCPTGYASSGWYANGTIRCEYNFTETDPIWNATLPQECPANYTQYGVYSNGTIKCRYLNLTSSSVASSCKLTKRISDGYFPYGKFGCAIEFI